MISRQFLKTAHCADKLTDDADAFLPFLGSRRFLQGLYASVYATASNVSMLGLSITDRQLVRVAGQSSGKGDTVLKRTSL
jgi:hypothetical protein